MKKSILTDAFGLSISKGITTIFSIVSTMLLSRFRTLNDYGTYSELLIIASLVSTIFFIGLPNSLNYFLPRAESKTDKRIFLSTYFTMVVLLGIGAGVVIVLSIPLWEKYFGNDEISLYWVFLLFIPLTKILTNGADNLYINFERTAKLIYYKVFHSFMQLMIIFWAWRLEQTFKIYLILYVFVEIMFSLIALIFTTAEVGLFGFTINRILLKKILAFSIPLGLASAVGILNVEMDKLIVGFFLTTEELAIYTNASRELPVAILASSFTTLLIPKMTKMIKNKQYIDATIIWDKVTLFSFYVIIFFVFFFVCHSKELITILYSEKYISGNMVFIIYSILLIFQSTYFGMFLNVTGNTKYIFCASLFSMLCNIALNILFYYIWGFGGPALSTLVCTAFLAFYQLKITSKIIKMQIKDIFDVKKYCFPIICLLIIAMVFYIFKYINHITILTISQTILSGILWAFMYSLLMFKRIKELILFIQKKGK